MATLRELIAAKKRSKLSIRMSKPPTDLLNKSEAAAYLHNVYSRWIEDNGFQNQHPNFHSLLSENARCRLSPSALKSGTPRGNAGLFGHISFTRIDSQVMYIEAELFNFFMDVYLPCMKKVPVICPPAKELGEWLDELCEKMNREAA